MILEPLVIFFKLFMRVIHILQPLHNFAIIVSKVCINTLVLVIIVIEHNGFCSQILVYLIEWLFILFLQFVGISIFEIIWYS
jgi:hypothetical protein